MGGGDLIEQYGKYVCIKRYMNDPFACAWVAEWSKALRARSQRVIPARVRIPSLLCLFISEKGFAFSLVKRDILVQESRCLLFESRCLLNLVLLNNISVKYFIRPCFSNVFKSSK